MDSYPIEHGWRVLCRRRHLWSGLPWVGRWLVGAMILGALTCGGCQRNDADDSTLVAPPQPNSSKPVSQPAVEKGTDPPGAIELPADADLNQDQNLTAPNKDPSAAPGGLEMPADAVPENASSNNPSTERPSSSNPEANRMIRYATWSQIEAAATSSGKVTVVDLWSLVCEPCLKEFPGLVRLHQQYGERVACIAVDVDYDGRKTRPPETYEERVSAFLASVGASFPAYISQTPSDDVYAANNLVSIPAVLVYDAQGKLVKTFEDAGDTIGFTYEQDIIPLVEKLAG